MVSHAGLEFLAPAARAPLTCERERGRRGRRRGRLGPSEHRKVCVAALVLGHGCKAVDRRVRTMDERAEQDATLADGRPSSRTVSTERVHRGGPPGAAMAAVAAVLLAGIGWAFFSGSGSAETVEPFPGQDTVDESRFDRPEIDGPTSAPASLVAAERFVADPSGETLRKLLRSIGGLEAMTVGVAEGAFDLVSFDPVNPDRLLASVRSGYGEAENQDTNEIWTVGSEGITQTVWAPSTPHDFAHFNDDGTITMWVRTSDPADFAPRSAVLLDDDGLAAPISTSSPLYASRFAAADGKLFALTGTGEYYAQESSYVDLVVDDGIARTILDSGEAYAWVDLPAPGLLIAYPRDPSDGLAVWSTGSLARLVDHPLDGRPYQRLAVSGDGSVAVAITADGRLESIEVDSGQAGSDQTVDGFGFVDPEGIIPAITLNHTGSIAITVDRSGLVSVWWVGDDEPIATAAGVAGQPRWLAERFSARTSTAVAPDAGRIAVGTPAQPGVPMTWMVVDTDVERWIERACTIAGRSLLQDERDALGLPARQRACG